jgi:peptidoglycan/xylan/chitin deacetylase (PgdA/CDA1 family)
MISAGYEEPVMEAFGAFLERQLNAGVVLQLNEVPETSPNLCFAKRRLGGAQGAVWSETDVACGTVRLPGTWDDYLSSLRPRFRTKVRSVLRNLDQRPEIRLGFCENREQTDSLLPALFELHTRRWNHDGKPGVFGWEAKRSFYFDLSARLLERGWLRFSWLEWKGRVLACQYGFTYGQTYFHLQEGYEPACSHWNIGIALRAWSIRELLKQGIREYDFLGGIGRHKTDWGAEVKHSKQILLARAAYSNLLFRRGREWEIRTRELVKRVVPQPILAARRAQEEKRRLAAFQPRENGITPHASGRDWMRAMAAGCYFHLQLPKLVRPLRERYELASRKSLKARNEPCARILYYHRVNDDGDPFFPAISTQLFEQQMRFLARHYKVVTLDRLLQCLEHGRPETVVAITFDDGYEDNYCNAFPILRRYGLPATIFLTTGCLDTREPLWFERMATALKTTECEFLDVEMDMPVRYSLRTTQERLEANGRITDVLRKLPDAERRYWLAEILRQLTVPNNGTPADTMLTWDQVRLMKGHGIDFGGHTVTHPFLSKTPPEKAAWEIAECKRRIEEEIQAPVSHFAYPNGREEDFSGWTKDAIRKAGYRTAASTIWGMNYQSTDRLELRRGQPWEENLAMFAYKLDWYQLLNE